MTLYKAGDCVRVRRDIQQGKLYNNVFCNGNMAAKAGQLVTIEGAIRSEFRARSRSEYHIIEDEYKWTWTDDMFEGTEDMNVCDINEQDLMEVINGC